MRTIKLVQFSLRLRVCRLLSLFIVIVDDKFISRPNLCPRNKCPSVNSQRIGSDFMRAHSWFFVKQKLIFNFTFRR